ncbi:MAG: hypothetical protein V4713_03680 [Pseudomonadota bacterium]
MLETHEWIEDFRQFEAVLVCLNELGEWDRTQTLRAFSTFGWNDASCGSDEFIFTHEETGVMVRHDGAVVAIEFGQEKLPDALADFFAVLASLGWRQAEVYHPMETMGMLLKDMGKSIPATMDLDVRPAASAPIAVPEVQMMLNHGNHALGGVQQHFQQLAMQELQSMGREAGVPADDDFMPNFGEHQFGDAGGATDGPTAEDDSERMPWHDDSEEMPNDRQVVTSHVLPPAEQLPGYGSEDEPRIASLTASNPPAPTSDRQVSAPMTMTPAIPPLAASEMNAPAVPKQIVHAVAVMTRQAQTPAEENIVSTLIPEQAVFKLGRSAICFDMPDHPIAADAIKAAALAMRSHHVEHLWPGMTDQEMRWDLIAEIDLETPWIAEIIATALMGGRQVRALMASNLLSLRRKDANAQLRDALQHFASALKDDEVLLEGVEHQALSLLQMISAKDFKEALGPVMDAFGGLLISASGDMFTDIREETAGGRLKGTRSFTLRNLAESPDPLLYVVHVDSLDGDTVHAVAGLMKDLARRYGSSMRRQKVMRAESDQAALIAAQEKAKTISDAQATIQAAIGKLREAGVSV